MAIEENTDKLIEVPAPTAWPMIMALGLTLSFAGLVTNVAVSMVGMILFIAGAVGWFGEVLPIEHRESVQIEPGVEAIVPAEIGVDYLHVGELGNRAILPLEIYPYSAGIKGGIAGGVVMAVLAALQGIALHGSPWYTVNILAATALPSLANASTATLSSFIPEAFIVAVFVHGAASILVGLLYAVSLPMFPRGATWRSGLLTPVLWSGLVAATLWTINPTLNARIDWGWFVASQIAYGLAASHVIARTAKIATMQNLPLLERAGIEGQREPNENVDL